MNDATTEQRARELVFVYGTLRREGVNHFRMAGADFVGEGTVRGSLYQIDWFPALVPDRNGGEVAGQLFEVDEDHLAALDAFESGENFERVEVPAMLDAGFISHRAWLWAYRGEVEDSRLIRSGDWLDVIRPRPAPLFNLIAWSPVLCLPLGMAAAALNANVLPAWPFAIALLVAPLVMTIGGWFSLRRRERGAGCASLAFFLGITGLVMMAMIVFTL